MSIRAIRALRVPARAPVIVLTGALLPLALSMGGDPLLPSRAAPPPEGSGPTVVPSAATTRSAPPSPTAAAAPTPSATASGMVTIESDSQKADNRTGIVTAIGNVRITYPDRGMVATSRQAQYFSREGRLVLSGDVDVVDAQGQRIRAERMVYRLEEERLVAEPPAGRQVFSRLRLQSRPAAAPAPIVP